MTLNEYQLAALQTATYDHEKYGILYTVLGLNGEAGEVADKVKKVLRDNNGEFTDEKKQAIALELGDTLWYVAMCAREIGMTLEEIAEKNNEKLRSRAERNVLGGSGDYR
jgi:NTP pyrophosphatase (non-canonical NTP hydrolase)